MQTHIPTHKHTHIHTCARTHTYKHTHIHTHTHTHKDTHTHTNTQTNTHTNTHYSIICAVFYDYHLNLYSTVFKITPTDSQSSFTLSTDYLVATFDGSTGLLQSIRRRYAGRVILTYVDFTTYSSPTSGAYLFLPNGAPQV